MLHHRGTNMDSSNMDLPNHIFRLADGADLWCRIYRNHAGWHAEISDITGHGLTAQLAIEEALDEYYRRTVGDESGEVREDDSGGTSAVAGTSTEDSTSSNEGHAIPDARPDEYPRFVRELWRQTSSAESNSKTDDEQRAK